MNAILVDDERDSLKILEAMIDRHVPEVRVQYSTTDPHDAIEKIRSLQPQILFLDVQMPTMTGFELLHAIGKHQSSVIFITASDRFALQALKVGALDYLVKPVSAEDLKQAVDKVSNRSNDSSKQQLEMLMQYFKPQKQKVKRIALTASDHLVFVETNDIVYCESDSNYTTFFLARGDKVVISKTLKDVEEILEGEDFFRIHASYLINMKHVAKFTRGDAGYVIMSNNQQITVSRKKKDEFFEMFSRL